MVGIRCGEGTFLLDLMTPGDAVTDPQIDGVGDNDGECGIVLVLVLLVVILGVFMMDGLEEEPPSKT